MGGDHRTHGLVKEFPDAGDSVVRYCQGGSPAMYRSLDLRRRVTIADGYVERRHLNPLHEAAKAPMLLGYPNLLARHTLRIASDGLDDMLNEADVVLAREPWQTPRVLALTDDDTPVIYSSHNVEVERFRDIHQPYFADAVERRVDALERRSVEGADAIVCTSERDADVYRDRYDPGGPIYVAPNGTYEADLRDHRPKSEPARRIRRRYGISQNRTVCLFMGSDYGPNVEAAEAVVDVARSMGDDIHILLMGSVGNSIGDTPGNVTVTGFVEEEFEAHFDAADIALNPMLSGGGTNIKLLDYFARSLPVLSTPFGVRGLDVEDDHHLRVAELDAFPECIDELSADSEHRAELGEAARALAAQRYTWEAASRSLRAHIVSDFGPFEE